jgi:ATP-dependent DNA helicase RecG
MSIPESQFSEDKQSLGEMKAIVETVAAFATCEGGTIRVGIKPTGERIGVEIGRTTLEDLARDIKLNTDPPQFPSITFDDPEKSAVISIRVDASPVKPVFAYNRPFKRVGRTNQRLSREEVKRLMEQTEGRTWDTLPCAGFTPKMIDDDTIREFLRRAGQDTSTDAMTVLENLSLLTTHGEICNGAVLLFAANTQRFFPEALVRCARFAGTTSVTFIDQATITGTALHQLDEAIKFVTRHTRQGLRITGQAEHETIPEYPLDAVREAIVNAICHRNYTETGNIQVRIYDDRFEVWNPGTLPPGLTFEALYSEHATRPRNPRFANALHHANVMEKWGTGTLRMIQACKDRNLPLPEFTSETGNFIARMRQQVSISSLPHYHDLNQRQQGILRYVRETGQVTTKEYLKLYGIGERQASKDLGELVLLGFFVRIGSSRSTCYEIVPLLLEPNVIWEKE